MSPQPDYERDRAEQRWLAQQYLAGVAQPLRERGIDIQCEVRVDLNPAKAIIACAADVIVLVTHGRAPVGRMLLGSVGDKVLRASPIPVLLHRTVARRDDSRIDSDRLTRENDFPAAEIHVARLSAR